MRKKKNIRFITKSVVCYIHYEGIRRHGGHHGIKGANLLESALDRASNIWIYDKRANISSLAAAYG